MVEIDARAAKVTRRWSTGDCKQPVSMAIDIAHQRLFSGCRSGVVAISDYRAGKVIATLPIGAGVDGAGYDAESGDAFLSNADGTLTISRTRAGLDGSQTFTKTIDSAGNSSTVQTAHDAAGNLVHYDPKN